MIICGYPCIGKSTLAKNDNNFIDLDPLLFNDGTINWWEKYCKVANDLVNQGYWVFISTHQAVVNYLVNNKYRFMLCYPSLELYDLWVDRSRMRWKNSNESLKDERAMNRIINHYYEDIKNLMKVDCCKHIIIDNLDYSLVYELISD